MEYLFPDAYAAERQSAEIPVQGTATGKGGLQGPTKKGPVGVAIATRTYQAWERIFGGKSENSDMAYEAQMAFDEGVSELITIRQAHYSDVTDPDSFTGGVAASIARTAGVGETAASATSPAGPFHLQPGDAVVLDVDNGGNATATFDAAPASIIDNTTYPVADQDGENILIQVGSAPAQEVIFSGLTTSRDSVLDQLNAGLNGVKVVPNGSQLEVITDLKGTSAAIAIVGGSAALTWAAPTAGSGDVADIDNVSAGEVKTAVEADTDALVTVHSDGSYTIASPTLGAASELEVVSGSAVTALGLTVGVLSGTDAGATYNTLQLDAGWMGHKSPGVSGNDLGRVITQNPLHASAGAGQDILAAITAGDTSVQMASIAGLAADSVVKITDGTNTEYRIVSGVRTVVGATVEFWIDLASAITNGYAVVDTQINSCEFDLTIYENGAQVEFWDRLSMLDSADRYVETIVNDEDTGSRYVVATDMDATPGLGADMPATDTAIQAFTGGTDETLGMVDADWIGDKAARTGIYGWDLVDEFMPVGLVGNNNALVMHRFKVYLATRVWFFGVTYVDNGMSKDNAIAFRNNVLGLDTPNMGMYAGGVTVHDPIGKGSKPTRKLQGLGLVMGKMATTDSLPSPDGGPWHSPAGEGPYGESLTAMNVGTKYSTGDAGEMNNAGINVIMKFGPTNPVVVWGSRTLSTAKKWRYINTRRAMQYYMKSIISSMRWTVHRNNDFRLWRKIENRCSAWFRSLMPLGAFPTNKAEEAFYVLSGIDKGVMTDEDRDNGKTKTRIGVQLPKTNEFTIFEFGQFDGGVTITEG